MHLPTVSQDTLWNWDGLITIKYQDEAALAHDDKVEDQFDSLNRATDAAVEFGCKLVDSGEHGKKVQEKAKWKSKPA